MSQNKRPKSLTQLIHLDTKDYIKVLQSKYKPSFNAFSLHIYQRLTQCYQANITQPNQSQLNSNAMLAYYSCYKGVLREAKAVNKKLSEEGLTNEIRLKQCIEVKSDYSKSNEEFEKYHNQCLESYRNTYEKLYSSTFQDYTPKSQKKE